jgi:S1-C subfamily serine protease
VVEAVAGQKVHSGRQLDAMVAARSPGQSVDLQVRRGGRTVKVNVVLGSRPPQAPQ